MTTPADGSIAPLPRRALAYVIDAAIAAGLFVIGYAISALLAPRDGGLTAALLSLALGLGVVGVVLLAWFLVYCAMQGSGGSIGMRAMGLRLVRADAPAGSAAVPLSFGRALLRNVVFGLSAAIVVGYFTPLFDGSGRFQGWHDRAAGALMLDARGARPEGTVPKASMLATPAAPPASAPLPAAAFAPPAAPVAEPSGIGHTLPAGWQQEAAPAPSGTPAPAAPVVPLAAPAEDPLDATVLSADAYRAAAVPEEGMITAVPGVSPAVAAPAPTPVSGPEAVTPFPAPPVESAPAAPVAPAAAPVEPVVPVEPVAPAAAPLTPSAPIAAPLDDEDDVEDTRISIPGHRLVFIWDDGARSTVSGRTLFGRNPAPEVGAVVVAVRDETLSLSKTHFEAAAEASGGWVMDRRSTNGMTIVRDGVRIACPPGERVRIRLGDAVEIGDRIVTVGGYA